jgi:hypothetical protein
VSKNPYLTLASKHEQSFWEKYQQTLTNTCWQIRFLMASMVLEFSLNYGTRGSGFASGSIKISKQIQTNVLAQNGFSLVCLLFPFFLLK